MPKFKFALERGGKKSLVIFCRQNYRDMEIRLDGNLLGAITNLTELKEGKIIQLPDGTKLHIQLSRRILYLIRNGEYLPGSLFSSAPSIYIIAALDVILGIIAMFLQIEILEHLGFGVISIAIGLILFVLGILVHYRSLTALILALITQGLSVGLLLFMFFTGFLSHYFSSTHDYRYLVSLFITTIYFAFFIAMCLGIKAIRKFKKLRRSQQ